MAWNTAFASADEVHRIDQPMDDTVLQQLPIHTMHLDDDVSENASRRGALSDRASIFSNSMESQLSNFTSCTNPTFDPVHRILEKKLTETEMPLALTKVIAVLGTILKHQAACIWQSSNTRMSLLQIGMFALHEKSTVRSASRHALRVILTDPVMAICNDCHPAASVIGDFVIQKLQQSAGIALKYFKSYVFTELPARRQCAVESNATLLLSVARLFC
ncbi:unnamed protein product [Gongylonema pulchrum]|uniref:CLASP_N domain-containing protein n=1 Tax=Gongylonema pulchrum TaxID=637853 RepID=A0A183EGF4_9BILA|nr:unnamed protein product [Gongylonema pulchrum]